MLSSSESESGACTQGLGVLLIGLSINIRDISADIGSGKFRITYPCREQGEFDWPIGCHEPTLPVAPQVIVHSPQGTHLSFGSPNAMSKPFRRMIFARIDLVLLAK